MNESGEVVQLLNNPSKMFFENIPYELMHSLYKAYQKFKLHLSQDSVSYAHTWEQGDMIIFDNRRIFHGREAFTNTNITRKIRGGICEKWNWRQGMPTWVSNFADGIA